MPKPDEGGLLTKEELREDLRLTPEEIFKELYHEEWKFYKKRLNSWDAQKIDSYINKDYLVGAKAQLNKVMEREDIALIDRDRELSENPYLPGFYDLSRGWEKGVNDVMEAGYLPVTPLKELK